MTTFKRSQAPEQAAFIQALRNTEPVCNAKVTYFKQHRCTTCDQQGEVEIMGKLYCTPCAYHVAN